MCFLNLARLSPMALHSLKMDGLFWATSLPLPFEVLATKNPSWWTDSHCMLVNGTPVGQLSVN